MEQLSSSQLNANNDMHKYRLNYPLFPNASVGEEEEQARERSGRVRRQNMGDGSKRKLRCKNTRIIIFFLKWVKERALLP